MPLHQRVREALLDRLLRATRGLPRLLLPPLFTRLGELHQALGRVAAGG